MDSRSDAQLAVAFAAHEATAFDEAYRRWGALLIGAALRVLGNHEDARDCVQDALTRAWARPGAYTSQRGSLRAFLVVCVRNHAISQMRSARRRAATAERAAREPVVYEEFSIPDFVENARLRRALESLPKDHREVVVAAYYRGRTHVEIAREYNAPLGTVKSRITQGVRKLAAALRVEESA